MFKVGDRIVYPMYGAGVVDEVQVSQGEEGEETHYSIRIPNGNLKIKVASKKVEQIGIRAVSCEKEIDIAIAEVAQIPITIQKNWNARYKENIEKIRSGDLQNTVEVSRNLMLREKERGLSGAEKKLLNNAKQIVVSEISFAKQISEEEAEEYLAKKLLS